MAATPPAPSLKKPTNLSLNGELLREAKALGINLSAVLEEALGEIVQKRRMEVWLEENRAAVDAYNEHVERRGVYSDGRRSF